MRNNPSSGKGRDGDKKGFEKRGTGKPAGGFKKPAGRDKRDDEAGSKKSFDRDDRSKRSFSKIKKVEVFLRIFYIQRQALQKMKNRLSIYNKIVIMTKRSKLEIGKQCYQYIQHKQHLVLQYKRLNCLPKLH